LAVACLLILQIGLQACGQEIEQIDAKPVAADAGRTAREAPGREPLAETAPASSVETVADYADMLEMSNDPTLLESTAIALASSDLAQAHGVLKEFLGSEAFLMRLDSDDAYTATYARLRLDNVVVSLARNPASSATRSLLSLIDIDVYNEQVLRTQVLIHALTFVTPSPEPAISFWREKSQPGSPLSYDVVEAILGNRSEPALDLFTAMLIDSRIDRYEKQDWLRQLVAPQRYNVKVLIALDEFLGSSAPQVLKVDIVEALFDYRPESWYIDDPVLVPTRESASEQATNILGSMGDYALAELPLTSDLRNIVEEHSR